MTKLELYQFLVSHALAVVGSISVEGAPQSALVGIAVTEKTVQFEGEAVLPVGEDLAKYKRIYFSAWPDGADRQNWPGLVYFVVRPRWIRFSDYDQQPPLIEEMVFD